MKSESGALLAENSVLRKLENWDIANTRKAYSQNMANIGTNIYILTSPTLKVLLSLLFILLNTVRPFEMMLELVIFWWPAAICISRSNW